jgi:hypothetical protein
MKMNSYYKLSNKYSDQCFKLWSVGIGLAGWDPDPHSLDAYFPNVTFSYLNKFWEPTSHFLGKKDKKNLKIEDTSRCVQI